MPEFPHGNMIWSTQGANLNSGMGFEVEVNDSVDDIADFLEEEFGDREFDEYGWSQSDEDGFSTNFESDDLDVSVNVKPGPDGKRMRVRIGARRAVQSNSSPLSNASVIVD